ncbi:hypothetical protein POTOM_018824 [Populus tomentosa]|uniref:Transmembrane protein n=1 Tax=Populus tomentosa TaxID=118781 RepID=A0A8X7ZUH0_POPTO|nr:hypothetical protein POTOM_018824 [Populus tomentosa]
MSLATYHHHLFTNSPPRITLLFSSSSSLSLRNLSLSRHVTTSLHSSNFHFKPQTPRNSFSFTLKAYQSDPTIHTQVSNQFNLDQFLSIAELLCIFSSSIITISYALNCTFSKTGALGVIGINTGFAWGMVVMVSGVVIGAWIRRRQWWRICRETGREGSLNLVGRIEKLEQDMRSSATIIRVLSRQLEKLGIRFRVTRKALKEPIVEVPIVELNILLFGWLLGLLVFLTKYLCFDIELRSSVNYSAINFFQSALKTAALAQKNSEATRALALQENILEKELGEMQKILLAIQDQQQKQLELILAIGKSGRSLDNRREFVQEQELIKTSDLTEGVNQLETHETQPSVTSKGSNNNRP